MKPFPILKHPATIAFGVLMIAIVLVTMLTAQAVPGGEIHGSIYALIRGESQAPKSKFFIDPNIFLPDVQVFLQNTKTNVNSKPVTTDLDGAFIIPSQPQTEYRLCWKAAGFVSGCVTRAFILRNHNVNLQPLGIQAEPGVVYGRVRLKDGHPCRFVAPPFGLNLTSTVAISPAGPVPTVRVNSYGEYVLAGLPPGPKNLTATCENTKSTGAATVTGGSNELDLPLLNSLPDVSASYATSGGVGLHAAVSGSTVQATIEAKLGSAGFPLHYRWIVNPRDSSFVSTDAPTVAWKVHGPGQTTMYVLVQDGHGGNALRSISLSTTPTHIQFSGVVTASDIPLVIGAQVTVNGVPTQTNNFGQWTVVLPKEEARYVVNIEKEGYQLLSRILYAPTSGAQFKLFRAQDSPFNAGTRASLIEKPNDDRRGVEVIIEPNSVALGDDGKGPLATGPLHLRMAGYSLKNVENQLPGDYAGLDGINAFRLSTFGSADFALRDATNQHYNLAPGKTATVRIPIDPAMAAAAPPTIPVWHYDTKQGAWIKYAVARRIGNLYEAKVPHFSAVNMDLAFADGACTRIVVDTSIMPVPFRLQMTPLSGGFVVDANHQNQVVDGSLNVVVREPPGTVVRFDVVDSNGNVIPAASQTITVGASSPSGAMWDPPPASPYSDCTTEIRYDINTVQGLFPTPPQGFLSYRTPASYLNSITAESLTTNYYQRIDPGGTKTAPGDVNDFTHWKTLNGFDRTGVTNAVYQNVYDLGFGRDMYMQTGGQSGTCTNCIAYYVTNYDNADAAFSHTAQKASVAMEFSPQNGVSGTPYTKFYVFNVDGSIANSVDLDGFGAKYVPTLCIICHNGNINSIGADGNLGNSRFIPFDLDSFFYPAALSRGAQETRFKALNAGIINQTNFSSATRSLITSWYGTDGDTSLPNPTFAAAVPSGWTSPTDESVLYNAVVKPSCRSCHTTRDPADPGSFGFDITWHSFTSVNDDSSTIHTYTCEATGALHHIMPQAKRTFSRFWLSTAPNGPSTLASSGLTPGFVAPNNNCQ